MSFRLMYIYHDNITGMLSGRKLKKLDIDNRQKLCAPIWINVHVCRVFVFIINSILIWIFTEIKQIQVRLCEYVANFCNHPTTTRMMKQ